jgi:hypothetical protein
MNQSINQSIRRQWKAVEDRGNQRPRTRGFESRASYFFWIWEGGKKGRRWSFLLGRGYSTSACSGGSSLLIGIAYPALKNVRWRAIINSIPTRGSCAFVCKTRCFSEAKSRAKPTTRKIDRIEVDGSPSKARDCDSTVFPC